MTAIMSDKMARSAVSLTDSDLGKRTAPQPRVPTGGRRIEQPVALSAPRWLTRNMVALPGRFEGQRFVGALDPEPPAPRDVAG